VGKGNGDTTGCGNVKSRQLSKTVGRSVSLSNILTNQYFCDSTKAVLEGIQQVTLARSAIRHLVQKCELTGSVYNSKKGVMGTCRSACTQDNAADV
jgi:hypothetical protein